MVRHNEARLGPTADDEITELPVVGFDVALLNEMSWEQLQSASALTWPVPRLNPRSNNFPNGITRLPSLDALSGAPGSLREASIMIGM